MAASAAHTHTSGGSIPSPATNTAIREVDVMRELLRRIEGMIAEADSAVDRL